MERSQVVPNVYQGYYTEGNTDIVKKAEEFYQNNLSPWQMFFWEAQFDRKVYLGDQKYLSQYSNLSYETLKFIFNKSQVVWNVVAGRQRQHRKATQAIPVQGSSSHTASQITKVLQSAYYNDDTYNKISLGFDEAGITGLGLLHSWLDYRYDPICGDLRTEVFSADMMMMDAFWREPDLSDCNFIRTRKYLSKDQVKGMLPGREKEIDALNNQAYFDTKFTFMPQQYNIRRKNILAYDEFWYLTKRKAIFFIDPETYENIEISNDEEEIRFLKASFPKGVIAKEMVPTVHLAILVNNKAMYDGPNPLGIDQYPFTPFIGYHDLANNNYAYRYQGVIRNIRDAQYLYNYRKQLELDLLAAQFSGVDVEEDALVDDNDAFKVGPGKVRFFKKNRLAAIRDVPGAQMNPINPQITEMIGNEIMSNAGVTPELVGQAEDSDVGITEQLRQGAALTTLQKLFDNLDLSQRNLGRLHIKIIQKNFTEGKVKSMIGEMPSDEFRNLSFQKYDCVVTNAPLTSTTKQLAFLQKYRLWKDGLPIPVGTLIEDLVIQDKDKLVQSIEQAQQQQQQMEQMQAQLQMQNQSIVNESLQSKSMSDRSLAQERLAKIKTDQAANIEKISKSIQDRDEGTLAKIKTIKEMQGLDVDTLAKQFALIQSMQQHESDRVEKQTKEAVQDVPKLELAISGG